MTISNTPFLRNVLLLDAIVSGAAGVLMAGGAFILAPLLQLPQSVLVWAGLALLPWTALLLVLARRAALSRIALIDVIAINALWVAASLGLLVSGLVAPNILGYAFVIAQALAVAVFAELQFIGLRRARLATA